MPLARKKRDETGTVKEIDQSIHPAKAPTHGVPISKAALDEREPKSQQSPILPRGEAAPPGSLHWRAFSFRSDVYKAGRARMVGRSIAISFGKGKKLSLFRTVAPVCPRCGLLTDSAPRLICSARLAR